jgi:hypothetical protein
VALLLLLAHLPQGCAVAETYRSGGSTAVIEQSGPSRTQVTRYPDGHRIVTRGGSGTDITVQRGPGGSGVDTSERLEAYSRFDWADDDGGEERFSSPWDGPDEGREAFRQRMLERMRLDACR